MGGKKKCPKCGCSVLGVTAHVTQDWLVDGNGMFLKCTNECVEVTHQPDDDDIWACTKCGFEAAGKEFNIREKPKGGRPRKVAPSDILELSRGTVLPSW